MQLLAAQMAEKRDIGIQRDVQSVRISSSADPFRR